MAEANRYSEVTEILNKIGKSEFQNDQFKITINETTQKGNGFLSEFFTGTVVDQNDSSKELKIAIKKPPIVGFFKSCNIEYTKEINFYLIYEILNKFQIEKGVKNPFNGIPKYFLGNKEPNKEFVAMEDIRAAGYELFDKTKYFDADHLELIIKTYAKFHALSFAYKNQYPEECKAFIKDLVIDLNDMTEKGFVEGAEVSFRKVIEAFDKENEAYIYERLKSINVIETYFGFLKNQTKNSCIIHGDCWTNNMMFKYNKDSGKPEIMKIIDFQIASFGSPIYDLSCMFYSGASPEDMEKTEYYLDLYYKTLSNFIRELNSDPEQVYSYQDFREDWKKYAFFGVLMGVSLCATKKIDQKELAGMLDQQLPVEEYERLWGQRMDEIYKQDDVIKEAKHIVLHAVKSDILP